MPGDPTTAGPEHTPLTDVAGLRAGIYGLLGALFLPPTEERLAAVALEAVELRLQSRLGPGFPFDPVLHSLLDALAGADDERVDTLTSEYHSLFVPLGTDDVCLPYESHYAGDQGMQGSVAADVERAYAEGGLTVSASMRGELPDHIALELEFMAVLCGEEAARWAQGRRTEAETWLRREQAFLHVHLGRCFPPFARCVRRRASETRVYRRLADASHAVIVHDTDLVDALLHVEEHA